MHALIRWQQREHRSDLNDAMHAARKIVYRPRLHLRVECTNTRDNLAGKASRGRRGDLHRQGWIWGPLGDLSTFL